MAQNTQPIFTLVPRVSWGSVDDNSGATPGPILSGNTATDGTGFVTPVFTAGSNGSYVQRLIARPIGTNVITVLRVFVNNGSTNATQANNVLIGELTLPATSVQTQLAQQGIELALNFGIPAGYVINVTLGAAVAGGYRVSVVGGDY